MNICTKFHLNFFIKRLSFPIFNIKEATFHAIPEILGNIPEDLSIFSDFQIVSDLRRSKSLRRFSPLEFR